MKYLISPQEKTSLNINLEEFSEKLKFQWTVEQIQEIDNNERIYLLEWEILIEERTLQGMVSRNKQTIALDGDLKDCVNFAIWFCSQVETQYKLYFYDQEYSGNVGLKKETTREEIEKFFLL